ncbi:RNase H domain-containing protein [Trichonephila clavipes]|nr:RNase H domain-containing protein [Trichonephila clavipes]
MRWIGRGGYVTWPPCSPDLKPLDFFFKVLLKWFVYEIPEPAVKDLTLQVVVDSLNIASGPDLFEHIRQTFDHSRSSIQYLKNWPKIMDSTGLVISKSARLDQRKQMCLQSISSHVGVPRNKAADELAGTGCDLPNPSSSVLIYSEIPSLHEVKINLIWRNPPAHTTGTQLRVLVYLYSAGDPGHFRQP